MLYAASRNVLRGSLPAIEAEVNTGDWADLDYEVVRDLVSGGN